ncbi:hypothetical protein NHX12_034250 [Muraenolepis orangiensis]|uniref:RNA helicase n=1 Tax=Muraenolepis orangiensis TaxID=630683 RepID=A0A9Q0D2Y7_9TELE|nr:hypothetical protein NHX12_034250 [Muraenolepis orangiensis]
MVKVRHVPGLKTLINEHDVRRLVLDTGKGTGNPEHLELLKDLCQGGGATRHTDTNHIFGPSGSLDEQLKDQQNPGPESQGNSPPDSQPTRLHPQVRWYQTLDRVVLTVQLVNPEGQRCDFYPDRVVYSGTVAGRRYRADLGLSGTVVAELCSWTLKSNQPVLLLIKEPTGLWKRLLRQKHHLVKYDLDHQEEDDEEEATHTGLTFTEDIG